MENKLLAEYLDFTKEVAYEAGKLTLKYFRNEIGIEYKEDHSPVTIADRKSEEYIRSRIEKKYPLHTIVGEEYGLTGNETSSHRWFIDPIDGTKSFISGVPLYSVLIGLEIEGTVEVGVAFFPALGEMIASASSLGCWWNGKRVQVSNVDKMERARVAFTSPSSLYQYNRQGAWQRIMDASYFQAGWGDAYGYTLVATGRVEVMLDPIMSEWDSAPFPPILKEAGGYFGDWQGNPTIYGNEGLACNCLLLDEILSLIEG